MMDGIFLEVLNRSITVSWLILAVVLLRLFLKKAPKWISCVLWALVAIRLLAPMIPVSSFSLIPNAKPIGEEIVYSPSPEIVSGVAVIDDTVNPIMESSLTPQPTASANPVQLWLFTGELLWKIGMAVMLLYAGISYLRIQKRVRTSLLVKENIFISDNVDTPFLLGAVKPHIFLPSTMDEKEKQYVLAHERAHIERGDHWWKPLGFLILTVYWFQPLCWLAYVLFCRDLEFACDERVIQDYDMADKKAYSDALLNNSMPRKRIAVCPLTFGEVGVKERIKEILNYKKPMDWLVTAAIVVCGIAGVCFLTNPGKTAAERAEEQERKEAENVVQQMFSDVFYKSDVLSDGEQLQGEDFLAVLQELCGSYFTEQGWQEAMQGRVPTLGAAQFQKRGEEPSKMALDFKEQGTEGWYLCDIDLHYGNGSDIYLFTVQIVTEGNKRLINSISRDSVGEKIAVEEVPEAVNSKMEASQNIKKLEEEAQKQEVEILEEVMSEVVKERQMIEEKKQVLQENLGREQEPERREQLAKEEEKLQSKAVELESKEDTLTGEVMKRMISKQELNRAVEYGSGIEDMSEDKVVLLCKSESGVFEAYGFISPEYGSRGIIINNIVDGKGNWHYLYASWYYSDEQPTIEETGENEVLFTFYQSEGGKIVQKQMYFDAFSTGGMEVREGKERVHPFRDSQE